MDPQRNYLELPSAASPDLEEALSRFYAEAHDADICRSLGGWGGCKPYDPKQYLALVVEYAEGRMSLTEAALRLTDQISIGNGEKIRVALPLARPVEDAAGSAAEFIISVTMLGSRSNPELQSAIEETVAPELIHHFENGAMPSPVAYMYAAMIFEAKKLEEPALVEQFTLG